MYHRVGPNSPVATSANIAVPPEHVLGPTDSKQHFDAGSLSSASSDRSGGSSSKKRRSILKKRLSGVSTSKRPEQFDVLARSVDEAEKGEDFQTAVEGSNDVLEVWFSGCHEGMWRRLLRISTSRLTIIFDANWTCVDVGGGSVLNEVKYSLSGPPLRWMVRQAILAGSGVKFDAAALAKANIDIHGVVGKELDELDKMDALQPIYDSLKRLPIWWIVEIMPMTYVWQDGQGVWHRTWK